jgi:hypothetical protein
LFDKWSSHSQIFYVLFEIVCEVGSYTTTNDSASCTLCSITHSTNSATGLTSCTGCIAGYFNLNNNKCDGNNHTPSYLTNHRYVQIIGCNGGAYCPDGTSSSITCGAHAWSNGGAASLNDCYCLTGSSGNPSTGGCTLCGSGSYSAVNGSVSCITCVNGAATFESSGATRCDACNAGYYGINSVAPYSCNPCASGSYCGGGTSSPIRCGAHSWSLAGSSSMSSCYCLSGYNGTNGDCSGNNVCPPMIISFHCLTSNKIVCPIGSYTATNGSLSCVLCSTNNATTSTNGLTTCDQCLPGYHNLINNACTGIVSSLPCIIYLHFYKILNRLFVNHSRMNE